MTSHIPVQLQEQDDKTWITFSDAARILNVRPSTIRAYVVRGVFSQSGKGSGARVCLGDVRKYDKNRNPAKVIRGKRIRENRDQPITSANPEAVASEVATLASAKDVEPMRPGMFEIALKAREELAALNDRLTILLTRKAELEEVVQAVEKIEQFARLTTEEI